MSHHTIDKKKQPTQSELSIYQSRLYEKHTQSHANVVPLSPPPPPQTLSNTRARSNHSIPYLVELAISIPHVPPISARPDMCMGNTCPEKSPAPFRLVGCSSSSNCPTRSANAGCAIWLTCWSNHTEKYPNEGRSGRAGGRRANTHGWVLSQLLVGGKEREPSLGGRPALARSLEARSSNYFKGVSVSV